MRFDSANEEGEVIQKKNQKHKNKRIKPRLNQHTIFAFDFDFFHF